MNANEIENLFGKAICSYTRKQAIEDGELVNVSDIASEANIILPVAMSRAAWVKYVSWTDADSSRQTPQDIDGRLWDILWMFSRAMRTVKGDQLLFTFIAVPRGGRNQKALPAKLKAIVSGGDHGEPVITIMLPDED